MSFKDYKGLWDVNCLLQEARKLEVPFERFDQEPKTLITSAKVLLAFLGRHRHLETLTAVLDVNPEALLSSLREHAARPQEPLPQPFEHARVPWMTFTTPVYDAFADVAKRAQETHEIGYWTSKFVAHLFAKKSDARAAILAVSNLRRLTLAQAFLVAAQSYDIYNIALPTIFIRSADDLFEENPGSFKGRMDLDGIYAEFPLEVSGRYLKRVCIRAAANEARRCNALEVTLDHMLLAMLQPCTAVYRFLEERGVGPQKWVLELEAKLPPLAEGPRWPSLAASLQAAVRLSAKDPEPDPTDDKWERLSFGGDNKEPFHELFILKGCADDPDTIGHRLLLQSDLLPEAKTLFPE